MIENYFDRISYNCRPHEVFNKDWSSYSPQDFADTFLPYAHIYRGTNLLIVDGAQLFQNVKQSQKNVLTLTQPDEITKIIVYTFAKHSLISSKKINVKPSPEELLTFVEVDENNKLYLEFKFGRNFKKMITSLSQSLDFQNSLDQIETKTFSMSLADFQKKFENGAVHFDQMSMILETIGVKPIKILKQIQQNLYAQLFKKVEDNGFVDFDEVPFDAGQTTGSYPNSWAHGDIERKALTEALYTEEEVFQVYYGNWLRDMSSVIDTMVVGFIARDAKLIRDKDVYKPVNAGEKLFDPFWILTQKCTTQLVGYYTTQTFIKILDEPTSDFQKYLDKHSKKFGAFTINNLGLYRPEEHIDNPKYMRDTSVFGLRSLQMKDRVDHLKNGGVGYRDYPYYHELGLTQPIVSEIDYISEMGQTTQRLQTLYAGELSASLEITEEKMKAYIKIDFENRPSSLTYISQQLRLAATRGRAMAGFRHLGAALHVIEDYFAHSNFVELALIKHGKLKVNPWVQLEETTKAINNGVDKAAAIPVVTGTFGTLDVAASALPKVLNAFRPSEKVEAQVKKGDRTVFDKAFLTIIKDFINREAELEPHEKMNIFTYSLEDIKRMYRNYLRLRDAYKDATDNMVMNALKNLTSTLNSLVEGLDLFSRIYDYFTDLILEWLLDRATKGGQRFVGNIEKASNPNFGTNPTHTQLAKDSPLHPLNPLAGRLAKVVVADVAKRMTKCWKYENGYTVDTIIALIDKTYLVHPVNHTWMDEEVKKWIDENSNFLINFTEYENHDHSGHFPARKSTHKPLEKSMLDKIKDLFWDVEKYFTL